MSVITETRCIFEYLARGFDDTTHERGDQEQYSPSFRMPPASES